MPDPYYCTKCKRKHTKGKIYNDHKKFKEETVVDIEEIKLTKDKIKKLEKKPVPAPRKVAPKKVEKKEEIIVDSSSSTVNFISKFFKPGTIKVEKQKDKNILKDVFNNSIDTFRFLSKKEANILKAIFMIGTIADALKYKDENIFNYISAEQLKKLEQQGIEFSDLEKKIQKTITISSILNQLKEKSISIKKQQLQQKIIVAGLDKAGKTAILTTFGGKLGIDELTKLKPTKRVDRQQIDTDDLALFVWDFGGQTQYRKDYLKNPEAYFLGVDLLLYVIDVQDYGRFEEAFTYLRQILDALVLLEEVPHLLIFVHKFDPDLREDPDIQLNVEFIKENLKDIVLDREFEYEIYLTSIYSQISNEPEFSKFLKQMVNERDLVADPTLDKLDELTKIVRNALNAIIKLSESMTLKHAEINARFEMIEDELLNRPKKEGVISFGAPIPLINPIVKASELHPPPAPGPVPDDAIPPPIAPHAPPKERPQSIRSSIISELKTLIQKNKELSK